MSEPDIPKIEIELFQYIMKIGVYSMGESFQSIMC